MGKSSGSGGQSQGLMQVQTDRRVCWKGCEEGEDGENRLRRWMLAVGSIDLPKRCAVRRHRGTGLSVCRKAWSLE